MVNAQLLIIQSSQQLAQRRVEVYWYDTVSTF